MNGSSMRPSYDLVVAGGGITGAGVFHAAVRKGFRVLLVEARDFAWGTSSRSSKMVHGGLRYLKQGRFRLTRAAVKERENLLQLYPGLVEPLDFAMPLYKEYGPSRFSMKVGLALYGFMAKRRQHHFMSRQQALSRLPGVKDRGLIGAVGFQDAQVDDARLVLRLINDAVAMGGTALNYTRLIRVVRDAGQQLAGGVIKNETDGREQEIAAKVLINATGPYAEQLHPSPPKGYHIRALRGSHLIFPGDRIPLDRVISFIHPQDSRPVFLFPWEGCVCFGTTDVDHDQDMNHEPRISMREADYLIDGVKKVLPGLGLTLDDCTASIAGVRPVFSRHQKTASRESREHVVWKDNGLISVAGGKLTTFRLLAEDALKAAQSRLPAPKSAPDIPDDSSAGRGNPLPHIDKSVMQRLLARYGRQALAQFKRYDKTLFKRIGTTQSLWAELCHGAGCEKTHHLSDLMLRRSRIGLLLEKGGAGILDRVQEICGPYLDWDKQRWEQEKKAYLRTWQRYYSPPVKPEGA